jgi:predicted nucleotidyltransferase
MASESTNTSVMNKQDIISRIEGAAAKLRALGVNSIGLFGSFARGSETNESDVDLLVEFAAGAHTFDNYMDTIFF